MNSIPSDQDEPVRLIHTGPVRTLLLNRPEKRNAVSFAMQRTILSLIRKVAADGEARALVLAGEGRSFCAGGELSNLEASSQGALAEAAEIGALQFDIARAMLGLTIPAVAAVNGAAAGFGAGLVALCDLVIVAEDAALWDPHTLYGVAPSIALQLVWPRLTSLAVARDLLMTGRKIDAAEAVRLGLASRICPAGQALSEATALAESLAKTSPTGLSEAKRLFNRALLDDLAAMQAA